MGSFTLFLFLSLMASVMTASVSSPSPASICLTEGCILQTAELLQEMDRSVDPCQDFYQFACGGFLTQTVIPQHKTISGKFWLMADQLNIRLRTVFEAEPAAEEPNIYKGVRELYQSCMDRQTREERSLTDLAELLSRLGGWPVVEGDNWERGGEQNYWHWLSVRAAREGFDTESIIKIGIITDPKNTERRIIEIDQFSPGLSREYLMRGSDSKEVEAYYNFMVNMAVLMGADRDAAEDEMKEALELELKLAEIALPKEERRNKSGLYHPLSLAEAERMFPEVSLAELITAVTGVELKEEEKEEEILNLAVPSFLTAVREELARVGSRVEANYMVWRIIMTTTDYLTTQAEEETLQFKKVLTGQARQLPDWEKCSQTVAGLDDKYKLYKPPGSLANAVGAMYAKKFFPLEAKNAADKMVDYVKAEFKKILDEVDWMDSVTRAKAQSKVDKMTAHMGYSKEILDDNLLTEFYSGLEMKNDSFLLNMMRLRRFIKQYNAAEFREPVNKTDWRTHGGGAIANAWYRAKENSITIPAGFLTGTFFNPGRPNYMNYAAIGMVVGHELTHLFDDRGSQNDEDGNLEDWWEPETKEKFLEKTECMMEQYSNYTVEVEGETLHLNGLHTRGENIADNGGVIEAYRAYQQYVLEEGEEPVLPALGYSQNQLFWISVGHKSCTVYRPQALRHRVLTAPHAPERYRVNGPLSNIQQFARDWNCPLGSPMNPLKKCRVW